MGTETHHGNGWQIAVGNKVSHGFPFPSPFRLYRACPCTIFVFPKFILLPSPMRSSFHLYLHVFPLLFRVIFSSFLYSLQVICCAGLHTICPRVHGRHQTPKPLCCICNKTVMNLVLVSLSCSLSARFSTRHGDGHWLGWMKK